MTLTAYSEFRPTAFDSAGTFLPDRQAWLVAPVGRNRDSGPFDESNFTAALAMLGGESDTVEVHNFGHWACGWFEIIIVAPDTPQALTLDEMRRSLEDYPLLDDEDHSNREYESILANWGNMSMSERAHYAEEYGFSIFSIRAENPFDIDADGDWPYIFSDDRH